ncbi:male sterility protein [Plectosphaerella cucumerina]|uniref:Fatty acyl-CoA reductase n=1 Tax=Plectosphaerella cucumerina TaxID=40658 RepID=A0A8K0TVG3_9PEZI|nr:male sterility protein [Plectosphaerella cucumerina]
MADPIAFFSRQVVLLTGATGHLGACLLYKLTLVLGASQVYVLIRTQPEDAIAKWKALMPADAEALVGLIRSKNIIFLQGDMVRSDLGLTAATKRQLAERVSIVINAAADISLKATLRDTVVRNCQSALELARLASDFPRLLAFVQVSSLFALSFLRDGPVREELHPIPNAERVYRDILAGTNEDWEGYAWPYARSKHLMECLLTQRYARLPLILLRPSSIGPAIAQPFEMYGHTPSIPINNLYARLMAPNPGTSVFHATQGSRSGTNVLDEIPVDLVADVLLQHVQRGSRGPIHAGAHIYIPRQFDQVITDAKRYVPPQWRAKMTTVVFSTDPESRECQLARFYRVSTRGWTFCVDKSASLDRAGPLGLDVPGHDGEAFTERRVREIFRRTVGCDCGNSKL